MSEIIAQLKFRNGTAAAWTSANTLLDLAEIGIEADSFISTGGMRYYKVKIGDGMTTWNALPYTVFGLPGTTIPTLAQVLDAGNDTGGFPIKLALNDTIDSAVAAGIKIDFGADGKAFMLTTDGGAGVTGYLGVDQSTFNIYSALTTIDGGDIKLPAVAQNELLEVNGAGILTGTGIASADVTAQGNTFNGPNQLVKTNLAGQLPASVLPSYVDDVLEYANLGAFPGTGETGKIYTALDTEKIYRWSGSVYIEISPSPGSSDGVPEGSVNLYFTMARVLATTLTGLTAAAGTPVAADTVLQAFGKIKYFIDNAAATILGTVLSGFSAAGARTAINATDTILVAFGKVQKYLNDLGTAAFLNVGTAASTVAAGDDARFSNPRPRLMFSDNIIKTYNTNTNHVIISAITIPANTVQVGDEIEITARIGKVNTSNNLVLSQYISNNPAVIGTNLFGSINGTSTQVYLPVGRRADIRLNGSTVETEIMAGSGVHDANVSTNSYTTYTIDWTQPQYLLTTVQLSSTLDTAVFKSSSLKINRQ